MKKTLVFLLCLLLLICPAALCESGAESAPSADVMPLPPDENGISLENGHFDVRLEDLDHADEGWFTMMLYRTDEYDPEQIKSLRAGDTVLVNGEVYTVVSMDSRDIGWFDEELIVWEIETEEECWDGIHFQQYGKNTFAAYVGDWSPVTFVAAVKITLPLDESFELVTYPGGEEPEYWNSEHFLATLEEDDWGIYNEYNTSASFKNGKLVHISRSGYPHGPRSADDDEDDDC